MTKYHNLNEKIFNNYINKQCNKPTDLLMSPFHPFYFITYENYNYNDILIPGKKLFLLKKNLQTTLEIFQNFVLDIILMKLITLRLLRELHLLTY